MKAFWLLLALVLGASSASPASPAHPRITAADEAAAAHFLEVSGHRLRSVEPSAADLQPIVAKLSGARVIGLGEVTHGTHEDVAFKGQLLRELIRAGAVNELTIEANRIVGVGFDRYVRTGQGDPAAQVLSPSAFKIFKNDEFASVILWLRAWNIAHPGAQVGVTAIDDQDGAVDANFALKVVARHDQALAQRLRTAFASMIPPAGAPRVRPSDWIAAHTSADVTRVLATAAELRDAFIQHASDWAVDPDYPEAAYASQLVWQNISIFEREVKGADVKTFPVDYWSRRDRYMADNLLTRIATQTRAALWAHDDHVMHTYTAAWLKQGTTGLGVEVRRRLGIAYRTIGFTYTRGTITATRGNYIDLKQLAAKHHDVPIPLDNGRPNTTGRVLARLAGDAWWFDSAVKPTSRRAERWLKRPLWNGSAGWIVDASKFQTGDVAKESSPLMMGFDILVWFRNLSPQHRWPDLDEAAAAREP